MPQDIAVYLNNLGETASLYKQGRLVIYHKTKGQWQVLKEKDFSIKMSWGIKELRKKMLEVVEFLGDCRIFVGQSLTGLPYFMLERISCRVWEVEGIPPEFLDYILEKEEEELKKEANTVVSIPTPTKISEGCFYISLKEIQENNSGITSKQVILPFLKKAEFHSLEIHCNHIPPWLENELITGHLAKEVLTINPNEIKLILSQKT